MSSGFSNFKRKVNAFSEVISGMSACYKRKINFVHIFATNRCNSSCKICNIWAEKPKIDLSIEKIEEIINSKTVEKNVLYHLLGGEFILHPKCKEILELLNKKHKKYILFSNGLVDNKLIELVKKFKVKNLYLSLDGNKKTYKKVRGVDGYDKVLHVIKELKDITNITLTYVINPLNSRKDFIHVKKLSEKYNVGIAVAVFDTRSIYNPSLKSNGIYSLKGLFENNYLKSYKLWKGGMKLPCYSIRSLLTVMPNGNVMMCQQKDVVLGNVLKENIDNIWARSLELQNKFVNCNQCWISCHRSFDNNLCKLMNTFIPDFILNRFIGYYDWNKFGKII